MWTRYMAGLAAAPCRYHEGRHEWLARVAFRVQSGVQYDGHAVLHQRSGRAQDKFPAEPVGHYGRRSRDPAEGLQRQGAVVTNPFAGLLPGDEYQRLDDRHVQPAAPYPQFTGVTRQDMSNGGSYLRAVGGGTLAPHKQGFPVYGGLQPLPVDGARCLPQQRRHRGSVYRLTTGQTTSR